MKKDSKPFKILINLNIAITSIALVIFVGCTFVGVTAHYVAEELFGQIEEMQATFIVWVVFAAGGATYRTGNHSTIEVLYEIFPKPIRKIVSTFIGLVVTAVLRFLYYASIGYLQFFMCTGRITAMLNLPFTWTYTIVSISCTLQAFNYFLVDVFGYEDEVEKLIEEGEDE